MLRMAAIPAAAFGPTRFSQIRSPVLASSACTVFIALVRYLIPLRTTADGSFHRPSFTTQTHPACRAFTPPPPLTLHLAAAPGPPAGVVGSSAVVVCVWRAPAGAAAQPATVPLAAAVVAVKAGVAAAAPFDCRTNAVTARY